MMMGEKTPSRPDGMCCPAGERMDGKMAGTVYRNVRLLSPWEGIDTLCDLRLREGIIAEQGQELPLRGDREVDGAGCVVCPAFFDLHVHLRDPGQTHKEDILTGTAAAAAGGVSGVASMPNTLPTTDSPEILRYILEKAEGGSAKVYPVAAITKGLKGEELCDFSALAAAGAVAFSDDGRPVESPRLLAEAMSRLARLDLPMISHCEDLAIVNGGIINEGAVSRVLGVPGIDRASEDSITERDILMAEKTGARLHIAHVSTAGAVALIEDAKKRGVRVTAETCPHYFALNETELLSMDARFRMNPPLRTEQDRIAIRDAVCRGVFDCISTDHAPHSDQEKADFRTAPNGIIGLETSFAVSYTYLVKPGLISLSQLIELMSAGGRRVLGLPLPSLQVGAEAELALLRFADWTVSRNDFAGKSRNSPFIGHTLAARAERIF